MAFFVLIWIFILLLFLVPIILAVLWYLKNMKKEEELEKQMKEKGSKNY